MEESGYNLDQSNVYESSVAGESGFLKFNQSALIQTPQKPILDFRQYLAKSELALAFVKFILALKQADKYPSNPCELMKEFFGENPYPEWDQHIILQGKVKIMQDNIAQLQKENESFQGQIDEELEKRRLEEEERLRLEEEEANKKGGKKGKAKKR